MPHVTLWVDLLDLTCGWATIWIFICRRGGGHVSLLPCQQHLDYGPCSPHNMLIGCSTTWYQISHHSFWITFGGQFSMDFVDVRARMHVPSQMEVLVPFVCGQHPWWFLQTCWGDARGYEFCTMLPLYVVFWSLKMPPPHHVDESQLLYIPHCHRPCPFAIWWLW